MEPEKIAKFEDSLLGILPTTMAEKLINGLEERQRETLKELPKYGKITLYISLVILVSGLFIQIVSGSIPNNQLQLFQSLKSPTIGGILSIFFTIVAYVVNSIFAVWALTFVPYIALKAYKVSQKVEIPLRLNRSKWIQLFAVTFFPIIVFAIFASNIPQTTSSIVINFTINDALIIICGGFLVWITLWASIHFIPFRYIVIHLSIFSSLLYTTIFFAYVLGFGTVTYAAVLGMMMFLMLSSESLGEIARRVCIYDIDNKIADKITTVSNRENEIKLKEAETDVGKRENEMERTVQKLDNEVQISKQLQKIRSTQIEFNSRVNKTKLDIFNQKLEFFNQLYSIHAEEYKLKVGEELPAMIGKFKKM